MIEMTKKEIEALIRNINEIHRASKLLIETTSNLIEELISYENEGDDE